jgi:hypothetical protein
VDRAATRRPILVHGSRGRATSGVGGGGAQLTPWECDRREHSHVSHPTLPEHYICTGLGCLSSEMSLLYGIDAVIGCFIGQLLPNFISASIQKCQGEQTQVSKGPDDGRNKGSRSRNDETRGSQRGRAKSQRSDPRVSTTVGKVVTKGRGDRDDSRQSRGKTTRGSRRRHSNVVTTTHGVSTTRRRSRGENTSKSYR